MEQLATFCGKCASRRIPSPVCGIACPDTMKGYTWPDIINGCMKNGDYGELLIPIMITVVLANIVVKVLEMLFMKNGPFLNRKRQFVKLVTKEYLTPNTVRFRFKLPGKQTLGLPVGGFVKVHQNNDFLRLKPGEWNGREDKEADANEIERKYTPVTSEDDKGMFELVVKIYRPKEVDRFPDGGKGSYAMEQKAIGDFLEVSGPFGHIRYLGNGNFKKSGKAFSTRHIAMIAGGSGITPMLQIMRDVFKNSRDTTTCSIIFANQTEDDIILREELEALQPKLNLFMTLDRPSANWKGGSGFIDQNMIASNLPVDKDDCIVLLCGPPPMVQFACIPNLEKCGVDKSRIWEF